MTRLPRPMLPLVDVPAVHAYRQLARARRLEADAYDTLADMNEAAEREITLPLPPPPPELPLWLTVREFARQSGQHESSVRADIRAGRLAVRRFGRGRVRISRAVLEAGG